MPIRSGERRRTAIDLIAAWLTFVAAAGCAVADSPIRIESTIIHTGLGGPRFGCAAVALPDGSALIVGGLQRSLERFDPGTGAFETLPIRLERRRWFPSAVTLDDGRVLIVAGAKGPPIGAAPSDDSAIVFDPRTNSLTREIPLRRPRSFRYRHTATLLADGRVLLAGPDDTAEIIDSASGISLGPYALALARSGHSATQLHDGRVLLAGAGTAAAVTGRADGYRSVEIFDPRQRTSHTVAAFMHDERDDHAAWRLPDGRVLLAGGQRASDGKTHAKTEWFHPQTETFKPGPDLPTDGSDVSVVALDDHRWLLLGGESDDGLGGAPDHVLDSVTLFDASTMRFERLGRLRVPRDDFAACRLGDGRILLVGGLTRGDIPAMSAELLTVSQPADSR